MKSIKNCLMLQNILQLIGRTVKTTMLICDYLKNHHLEHKVNQENGHLALLGNNAFTFEESIAFIPRERT